MFFYSLVGVFYRKDIRRITYTKSTTGGKYCLALGSELTLLEVKKGMEKDPERKMTFKDRINLARLNFGAALTRGNYEFWLNVNLFRIYFLEDIAIGHREEDASNLHINSINLDFLRWLKRRTDYSNHVWEVENNKEKTLNQ